MGFLKRLAFYLGLVLGLTTISVAGTVALTYLFTGKFASIELAEGQPELTLMTPDEVVDMVRSQVGKMEEAEVVEIEGGEGDA